MEKSAGYVRGNVDSLVKIVQALEDLGIELIGEGTPSTVGGRGVRLRDRDVRLQTPSAKPRATNEPQMVSADSPRSGNQSD